MKHTFYFDNPTSAHWYWSIDENRADMSSDFKATIAYFERKPERKREARY